MSTSFPSPYPSRGGRAPRRSMALLVVLSILALVSVLVLAFFSQATLNRQTSFASVGQAKAENVAETALQTVVGDLREEIRAGSTNPPAALGNPVYRPSTNLNMLPQRTVSNGFMTLLKESVGASNAWSGGRFSFDGPVRSIAGNNTTNAAANGRYIPKVRWLRPQLMLAVETNSFQAPDWVVVTRQGPLTNAAATTVATLTNGAASNLSYAIGRYAYTVYDIGGLLDANVAGYSSQSGLTANDLARKGSLALVSLAGFGGLTTNQVDAFVQWRNPGVYNSYSNFVFGMAGTNGFVAPIPGNQGFVTRQDLIQYAASNGITDALPYLTAFSREKNAPSWSPGGSFMPASYGAAAENSSATNRDLANMRASDGSLLIKSRFDLDRLKWLTYKGPSANLASSDPLYNANGTGANILKYFGLVWDATLFTGTPQGDETGEQWIYVSAGGSGATPVNSIKTLDQVAAAGRAPDFFELLKATILSGSLGVFAQSEADLPTTPGIWNGNTDTNQISFRTNSAGVLFNKVPDYQIFNIAANILGQYSSDGYPPSIRSGGGNSVGVKSLPYEYGHGEDAYRPSAGVPPVWPGNVNRSDVYLWMKFVMWNPHRNVQAAAPSVGPTLFRVFPNRGAMAAKMQNVNTDSTARNLCVAPNLAGTLSPAVTDFTYTNTVEFPSSASFIDPTPLMYTNTTGSTAEAYGSGGSALGRYQDPSSGKQVAGIFLAKQVCLAWQVYSVFSTNNWASNPQLATPPSSIPWYQLTFQYKDWENNWRSYQTYYNIAPLRRVVDDNLTPTIGPVSQPYTNSAPFAMIETVNLDPRDRRFGMMGVTAATADPDLDNVTNTFRSDASHSKTSQLYTLRGTNFSLSGTKWNPADFANNVAASGSYYRDADGVVRPGDAGNRGGPLPAYLSAAAGQARPLVLNSPFRTVADMGYTFRDMPWKTLDFATTSTADAGLLDLFGQYGGTAQDLPAVGGKVNLNSAPAPVLQALLSGAALDLQGDAKTVTGTLSSPELATLMNAFRPASGTVPVFANKADLIPFFASNFPAAHTLKAEREAPLRVLSNVVQTRTWNLLIDVVAQSGRYMPGATGVNQFMVEGEKHYWLQVAIDRFTGEIVDEQLEPVYEQ